MAIEVYILDEFKLFFDIKSKYSRWYFSIIRSTLSKNRSRKQGYFESHHIVPSSLSKKLKKDKNNLVLLTAREHFIVHACLEKMGLTDAVRTSMLRAFIHMKASPYGERYTSKLYEYAKIRFANYIGNLKRGVKLPDERRERMRIYMLENNPFRGKKHSSESIEKMRKSHKGKVITEEHRNKISQTMKGRLSPNKGNKYSEESRMKLSNAFKGKTLTKEHKDAVSNALKGRIISEETRKKMSESAKNRCTPAWRLAASHRAKLQRSRNLS